MTKFFMLNFFKNFLFIFLFAILFLPFGVDAAELSFVADMQEVGTGDLFYVDAMVDVEECINTVNAFIEFPYDNLELIDFFSGNSILTLWIDKPDAVEIAEANKNGIINFSGGAPGGYCGKIPGDPGVSNVLGRFVFKVLDFDKKLGEGDLITLKFGDNAEVFLNDGIGTLDQVSTKDIDLVFQGESVDSQDVWQNIIDADNIKPEPFVVELYSNSTMFDGEKYVIFSTVDKQTGIDYYEVMEISSEENLGMKPERSWVDILLFRKIKPAEWKKAEIPYLLMDQTLESIIKVKAVDKAGNERVVEYIPPRNDDLVVKKSFDKIWFVVLLIVVILFIIFIVLIKNKREKNNSSLSSSDDL